MLNQRAVGGGFPPKSIGETAGRAEDLHRDIIAFAFWRADFRRIQVVRVAGIVEDQTVGFARRQTQAAAYNLLVKAYRLGWPKNRDKIDVRRVKAGGQYRDVHQIAILLRLKGFDDAIALRPRRFAGNQRRLRGRQQAGNFPRVFRRSRRRSSRLYGFRQTQRFG